MKKNLKLIASYSSIIVFIFSIFMNSVSAITNYTNDPALDPYNQVVYAGGTEESKWNSEGISVSKTIEGTGIEDYFDITLQVKTKKSVKEIMESEAALVVFVLDLSETMNASVSGGSPDASNPKKITSTVNQVKEFVKTFKGESANYPNNEIGIVGYNSDGYNLVGRQKISNLNLTTFNNRLTTAVDNIVEAKGYSTAANRFTNMHAGLLRAQDMINASNAKYKYIVFLTDGVPTTYSSSGYTGIATTTLKDQINGNRELVGGNYSDTGAIKAREVAMTLKSKGVKIYSVGVGLNTFAPWTNTNYLWVPYMCKTLSSDKKNCDTWYSNLNGEQFVLEQIARGVAVASTVENKLGNVTNGVTGKTVWEENRDTIQQKAWEFAKIYSSYSNYVWTSGMTAPRHTNLSRSYATSSDRNLFGRWLQYGIASGKYFEINNTSGFDNLAKDIINYLDGDLNDRRTKLWKTTDPMTNYGSTTSEYIKFIGFLNSSNQVVSANAISGSHELNGNNTASFATKNGDPEGTITWDLKKSGYKTEKENNATVYIYTLKYRVRLKTEKQGFVNESPYDTNGTTTLTYVTVDGNTISNTKTINYPIPKVKGYLTELKVLKTVEGIAPNSRLSDANKSFEFKVTFKTTDNKSVDNTFTYDKYNSDGSIVTGFANKQISDGETFTLENGQYVIIHNLFHDIKWTVNETNKNGFVSTITKGKNNGTTKTTIKLNEVTYNNKTYYLNMKKVDSEDNKILLKDVRFSLYTTYNNGTFTNAVTNMNGVLLQDKLTNSDGMINLGNLSFPIGGSATYYLVEEETIDKYSLLDNYVEIKVDANGITAKYDSQDMSLVNNGTMFEVTVPNAKGIDLPETGGTGNMLFIMIGVLTMLLSGIGYTINKKMENN